MTRFPRPGLWAAVVVAVITAAALWVPVISGAFTKVQSTAVSTFGVGLFNTGNLRWWGDGARGQGGAYDMQSRWTFAAENSAGAWKSVSVGGSHTCAIKSDDTLWCWGRNANGQLGLGNTNDATSPTKVGTYTWTAVAAGGDHTCAIRKSPDAGSLWCWGKNDSQQLGVGDSNQRTSPTREQTSSTTWTSISLGFDFSCGLRGTQLNCWGSSTVGQTGNSSLYGAINGTWSQVSAGYQHACAVHIGGVDSGSFGNMKCWGKGGSGQLGNGATNNVFNPVAVSGMNWAQVAAGGEHTCARQTNNTVWCSGSNAISQLGTGGASTVNFTQVGSGNTWSDIDASTASTCGRIGTALWCWGGNSTGEHGDGSPGPKTAPTRIGTITANDVSMFGNHACLVLTGSSALHCAGSDPYGQLGRGSAVADQASTPVQVGSSPWASISNYSGTSCGVRSDLTLWCWGANSKSQLGLGDTVARALPTKVGTLAVWKQVAVGEAHGCAVRSAGTLWCWGDNADGRTGRGTTTGTTTTPTQVGSATDWAQVASGARHTCGMKTGGSLWCWGDNPSGQVGNGNTNDQSSPVQVSSGVTTWRQLSLGGEHTCATRTDDTMWCWGEGGSRQLGNQSNGDDRSTPYQITGATGAIDGPWLQAAAGGAHTCGLRTNGEIVCWGNNTYKQVANDGNQTIHWGIIAPNGPYTSVVAGSYHTCAVKTSDSTVWCWGANGNGQLGNGTIADSSAAVQVTGVTAPLQLVAGGMTTFYIK